MMAQNELRGVVNAARKAAVERCGKNADPARCEAMTQLELARRTVDAEQEVRQAERAVTEAHRACASASARAHVAEQCRDAAEAKATGWKVVAVAAALVALLLGLSADSSRREVDYWKDKAQNTRAQPSIARVERDTELGRAVVWYQ